MLLALLSVVPVGLGLSLLAFGVPERTLLAPTPRSYGIVAAATVVLGPIAQAILGPVGWLAGLAVLIAAFIVFTATRSGGSGPRRHRAEPVTER